jgi:hypothetical protein
VEDIDIIGKTPSIAIQRRSARDIAFRVAV